MTPTIRLVIAGSRTVSPTVEEIDAEVRRLVYDAGLAVEDDYDAWGGPRAFVLEVISGRSPGGGADDAGEVWAEHHGIPVHAEPITDEDWSRWGKYLAPKARNGRMADRATHALCFWDRESNGTTDMHSGAADEETAPLTSGSGSSATCCADSGPQRRPAILMSRLSGALQHAQMAEIIVRSRLADRATIFRCQRRAVGALVPCHRPGKRADQAGLASARASPISMTRGGPPPSRSPSLDTRSMARCACSCVPAVACSTSETQMPPWRWSGSARQYSCDTRDNVPCGWNGSSEMMGWPRLGVKDGEAVRRMMKSAMSL